MNKAILAIATAMSIAACASRQQNIAQNAYDARIMELNIQSVIHEASHE
jgi:hypothetical protein